MASAELSRRVEKVVGYPPPSEMATDQRREFDDALLDAEARSRGLSPLRSPCRIRTIWRRPPHGQAGIVSVRVGTALQVSFPHAWQMCSATAGMLT